MLLHRCNGAFGDRRPRLAQRRVRQHQHLRPVAASPLNEGSSDAEVAKARAAGWTKP